MRPEQRDRAIQGQLLDAQTREPLAGWTIRLHSALQPDEKQILAEARSDKGGAFLLKFRRTKLAQSIRDSFAQGGPALFLRIHDTSGELVYITDERTGDDRFEPWIVAVVGLQPDPDGRKLNDEFSREIERFLKQPKILKLVARILSEEGGAPADKIYDALVDSDPFGIDPFTFRTTICCILNRLLDDFKQTALGSRFAVGGNTYKHLGSVLRVFQVREVIGFIQGPEKEGGLIEDGVEGREEVDQDFNFKIVPTTPLITDAIDAVERTGRIPAGEMRQCRFDTLSNPASEYFMRIECEITPCDQRGEMRRFMSRISAMARQARIDRLAGRVITPIEVALRGEVTFDGTHSGFPGHIEIHPVKEARVL